MEELPAERFKHHEVTAVLGRGGMGTVYRALDRVRGHEVALKCLSLERLSPERDRARYIALFEREYYALSQLEHPHIVRTYDFGRDEIGPYYSMELLRGVSLRARAPWPWASACSLLRDIASALSLLHARGLVHRDVTPLNVFSEPDGRAKLIDFGAMMPAGVPRQVVGTPAFIAPECLDGQSVDDRTDLFALGACLYYALTGQHAYPARTLPEVRRMWRTPARAVSSLAPDVPPALEELVHTLLHLRPENRPRTAADVYERLSVIAGLPRDEGAAVTSAYLTHPKLVGRDKQERSLRRRAQRTAAGAGGCLLLLGAQGLGRTRMLDAAARQAQLAGLSIARADASAGALGHFAVAERLLSNLAEEDAALGSALTALGTLGARTTGAEDLQERQERLHALVRALREACERAPCALLVDDVHAIDEPSLAFLAELSTLARDQPLLIVGSCLPEAALEPGRALALLLRSAQRLELQPLTAEQTRELAVSLFGEVPNVDLVASLLQQHGKGVPARMLHAAEACLARGLSRREGSSTFISAARDTLVRVISEHARPQQPVTALTPGAQALLSAIALDRFEALDVAGYQQLLGLVDAGPLFRALIELRDARRVEWLDARVRLAHEAERQPLLDGIPDERRRELQLGMAALCEARGLPAVFAAHYLFAAGELPRAVAAMDVFNAWVDDNPRAALLREPVTLETTDLASRLSDFPGAHPALRAKYGAAVVINAVYQGRSALVADRVPEIVREVARFSGLSDYAQLGELPPDQRLAQALARANERCSQPGVGALTVVDALRRQTQLSVMVCVAASFMHDPRLLDAIPDLTPFHGLSPALGWTSKLVSGLCCFVRGQHWASWDALRETYAVLSGPEAEALEPLTRMALHNTALNYLASQACELGTRDALELADACARTMPVVAESQRCRFYLARGDVAASTAARRRSELLSVRAGTFSDARVLLLPAELSLYALCDDGVGLSRALASVREVHATRPGFAPVLALATAYWQRSQGRREEALASVTRALDAHAAPHDAWQSTAALHVELLTAAERVEEAVARGEAHVATAQRAGLPRFRIARALAAACLRAGRLPAAERWLALGLAELEQRGASGVSVGAAYELGARIALAHGDRERFEQRAALCLSCYELGDHPALRARHNALLRDAARAGLSGERPTAPPASARRALRGRIDRLVLQASQQGENADFHLGLLDVLIEQAAAVGGVLYLRVAGGLSRLCAVGPLGARPGLDELVHGWLLPPDDDQTLLAEAATARVSCEDVALYTIERPGTEAAFLVALDVGLQTARRIDAALLRDLGESLALRSRGSVTLGPGSGAENEDTEDSFG